MSRGSLSRSAGAALLSAALFALAAPAAHATLSWDAVEHDFGTTIVGTAAAPKTFTLTASCDAGVGLCNTPPFGSHTFGAPTVSGAGFALAEPNTCNTGFLSTLFFPASATCTSTVAFTPAAPGPTAGALTLPNGPDITLRGSGPQPPSATTPGTKKCKKGKKRSAAAAKKKKCKKKRK